MFDWLLLGKPRHIQLSAFRLLSRVVVDGMLAIRTAHPFIPALLLHVTKDIAGVPMEHGRRERGRSSYTVTKRLRLFTDLIIHNSSFVLRAVGQLGLALSAMSLLMAVYIVYRKLAHGIAVVGWASLFTTQLLIGGLLLFSVGVIGEYLLRIIESSEAKPTYFVRRRAGEVTAAPTTR
jgi:dolichol-phosphate mannosyltransferase/undecaprenyl-phosphate 4-deoxy-4-formamido-L-arabinose transferase